MPSITGRTANVVGRRLPSCARWATNRRVRLYRSSGGRESNRLLGKPCFLLDVVGRKSGESRPVMLMLVRRGEDLLVTGSNAGNPNTPNWYLNLMAAGGGYVEVGARRWAVSAREIADGLEQEDCWHLLTNACPDFISHQQLTTRRLPIAVLSPSVEFLLADFEGT